MQPYNVYSYGVISSGSHFYNTWPPLPSGSATDNSTSVYNFVIAPFLGHKFMFTHSTLPVKSCHCFLSGINYPGFVDHPVLMNHLLWITHNRETLSGSSKPKHLQICPGISRGKIYEGKKYSGSS